MRTINPTFDRLRKASNSLHRVKSDTSTAIGVRIDQEGSKKAMNVRVLLPFLTERGNQVPADVRLTGAQARQLYETLRKHYEQFGG
jgi:hypothetical protein